MASNFELVGIEAVVQGMAAFTRDATSVDRLLNQINKTTAKLAGSGSLDWKTIEEVSEHALTSITTGTAFALAGISGLIAGTVKVAASFEQNIVRAGVISGATTDQIKELGDTTLKVAEQSRIGLGEIATAQNTLVRSGISLEDINKGVLKSTVDLSEASGGELGLAEAAKLVSVGMNVWSLSAQDVTKFTAAATAAANDSAIGFTDISSAIQLTAPLAVQLGISFQDLAATIGLMGEAGIKGTVAGTALKTMLVNLADPSKRALIEMKQFGITLQDVQGNMLPYPEIIKRISDAFSDEAVKSGKVTEAQRLQASAILFGSRSILASLAIANKGTESFNKLREEIDNTNVAELAAKMKESLIPQLDILNNKVQAFVIRLGEPLTKAIGKGVQSLNQLLSTLKPEVPEAFGEALLAAFSGKNIEEAGKNLEKVFGPNLGGVFSKLLEVMGALHAAIFDKIIPAIVLFGSELFKNVDAGNSLTVSLTKVADTIKELGSSTANKIAIFALLIKQFQQGAIAAQAITLALQVLAAVPFVALLTVFGRIAFSIAGATVQVLLIAAAFRVMSEIVQQVGTRWNGTISGMVSALQQLPVGLQILGTVITVVSALIAGTFIKSAIGSALVALRILNLEILETGAGLVSLLPYIAAVGIAFIAFEIATGKTQDLIDAFHSLSPVLQQVAIGIGIVVGLLVAQYAATAIGAAITSTNAFILSLNTSIDAMKTMVISIVDAVVGFVTMAANAAIATAALIFYSLQGIGRAIIAGIEFIANLVLMSATFALVTAEIVADSIIQAISIEGVAIAIGLVTAVISASVAVYGLAEGLIFALGAAYIFLQGGVIAAATSLLAFVGQSLASMLLSIPGTLAGLASTAVGFYSVATAAIAARVAVISAWVSGIVPIIVAGAGAVIAAIAPVLIAIGAISLAVGALYLAWTNDFLGIQELVNTVVNFILKKLGEFIESIKQIPLVRDALGKLGEGFTYVQNTAVPALAGIVEGVKNVAATVLGSLPGVDAQVDETALHIANMLALMNRVSETNASQFEYGPGYGQHGTQRSAPPKTPTLSEPGFPTLVGGAGAAKTKLEEIQDIFEKMLKTLPGDVIELSKFLAKLEQDDPGRLNAIVNELLKTKSLLEEINQSQQRLLAITQAIANVQKDINRIQLAQSVINAKRDLDELSFQKQLTSISIERLQIQAKLIPIQQQIAAVDKQIADLQRTDYVTERAILDIRVKMLPIQQQIAAVDKQIADAQRVNYDTVIALATLDQQALPIKQQIAELEKQINRTVDQRSTLLKRQQEIFAQQNVDSLTTQLDTVNKNLDAAWKNLNVPQILALEKQKDSLTDSVSSAQDQLTAIQNQQKLQQQNEELNQIALKLKEVDLQDILNTITDQTDAIQNQQAIDDAATAVKVANLNKTKQGLEDLLKPFQDQLDAINNIKDAQDLQTAIAINSLQQEKQRLEDLAAPYLARLTDLDNQSAAIQNQIDQIGALALQQTQQLDAQLLNDKLAMASLDVLKADEQDRFDKLVLGFANALAASGVFTLQEGLDVAQHLGFWDSEIAKLADLVRSFGDVTTAVDAVTTAIGLIPKDVTVRVHIQADDLPSYQYGGTVGGPPGSPQLIIAHGGERFLGVGAPPPLFTQAAANRAARDSQNIANYYNYEVNATYQQQQSPATVALDLRAVIAMSKR